MRKSVKRICLKLQSQQKQTKKNGKVISVTTKENAVENNFVSKFAMPLDLGFFKHPVYPYGRKEDLVEMLEFNSYEKVIFCSGDATETRRLLNTSRI